LDPFYSPQDRQQTSLPLRKLQPAAQASLWWLVVSGCRKRLNLLRPYIDENGAPWEPSPYWEAVLEKVHRKARRIPVAAVPEVDQAASLSELTVALALAGAGVVPQELEQAWRAARRSHTVIQKRQSWTPAPAYEGFLQAPDLQEELAARYSEGHAWSASRLNQYGMCPFSFFASSILDLAEVADPVEGFDSMQRGTLLHAVLERLHAVMQAEDIFMADLHQEAVLELLEQVCSQVFSQAPLRYGFRPGAVWQYEQDELRRLLHALVLWECEQASEFHPYLQELRFGVGEAGLTRFRFEDSRGTVFYLRGVIDRVDRHESQGTLRVLDYKSGSTAYSRPDLEAGRALQTPLYALAAEGLLRAQVRESAYLLIPKRELSGILTSPDAMAENETAQQALDQAGWFVHEIRRGAFPSLPSKPAAGSMVCSAYCSFASLCRVDRHSAAKVRRLAQ
jgi:ATP-dependent helicase/DNAse subunit B